MAKTLGESRVRIEFNASNDDYVFQIKQKAAELIDLINSAANKPEWADDKLFEFQRLKDWALTAVEEGAMWGVKMATL